MTVLKGPPDDREREKQLRQIGLYTAIPALLIAGPLVGYFGGSWLDGKLDTEPWISVVGLFLGFVASGREIASLIKKAQALDKQNDDNGT